MIIKFCIDQVTVERLFSSVKFILNDQRNRMTSDLLQDIMVVRANSLFEKYPK